MKLSLATVSSVAALLMGTSFGYAQTAASPAVMEPAPMSASATALSADGQFVHDAANGGKAEVALSKLALKKTANEDVKAFANKMIQDHGKANDELKALAKKADFKVQRGLDQPQKDEMAELKKLDGAAFDKRFAEIQSKEHDSAISAFQKESDKGANADLKAFATKTLPTLQEHKDDVKALKAKLG